MALDDKLERLVQRTGMFSLETPAGRMQFVNAVSADITGLTRQFNEVYYPLADGLPSGSPVDPLAVGLSGSTMWSFPTATSSSSVLFWDAGLARKKTVKESFDTVASEIARVETIATSLSALGANARKSYLTIDDESADLPNSRQIAHTADLSSTDNGVGDTFELGLANTAVTPGNYTYASVTVDTKGRVTAASSGTYLTPAFTTTAGVTRNEPGDYDTDDYVFGSESLDYNKASEASRVIFDKSKSFFGAGTAGASNWDNASRGNYSAVFCQNNQCPGDNSFLAGKENYCDTNINHISASEATTITSSISYAATNCTILSAYNSVVSGFKYGVLSGEETMLDGEGEGPDGSTAQLTHGFVRGFGSVVSDQAHHGSAEGYHAQAISYGQKTQASGSFGNAGEIGYSTYTFFGQIGSNTGTYYIYLNGGTDNTSDGDATGYSLNLPPECCATLEYTVLIALSAGVPITVMGWMTVFTDAGGIPTIVTGPTEEHMDGDYTALLATGYVRPVITNRAGGLDGIIFRVDTGAGPAQITDSRICVSARVTHCINGAPP